MTRRSFSPLYVLFLCLAMCFSSSSAFASHLRGTSVSWGPTAVSGKVQFTIQYSQRTSYGCDAGTCVLGGAITVPFNFGDGSAGVNIPLTITSLNAAEDYLSATGTFTHTYTAVGPFTAYYESNARVSTIKSGHDQDLRMETLVSPFSTNHSPVASMPAIVTVPLQASTGFTVSAADADGNPLSFRLSTASEMYGLPSFSCAAQQPPGLTINNSGQVTWDTTQIPTAAGCGFSTPVSGDLWTVQFMVQDLDSSNNVKSKTPVDLIIKFISSTEAPPTIVFSNPGPITATPGTPVTFSIAANDTTANSRVTFNATGLPLGATATNTNQTLTPPTSSTFSWTPTAAQTGSYVITYTITNDTFQQTLASVTINVPSVLPPVTSCPASLTAQYNGAVSIPVQVSDPQGDALTVVWSTDGASVHTDNVPASSSTSSLSLSQTFTTLGAHTVSITATDTDNASSSCSTPITVVAADQSVTFGTLPNTTYGGADTALVASSSSGLAVSFSASGSCSIVNGSIHAAGAGSCSVTASQTGNSVYNAAPAVTRTFQISQRPLTVTAQSVTRQYGVANPTFTGTITGIANSDAITATYASTATISSPVGTYAIVPTLAGATLSNYTQTVTNGTLTVTAGPAATVTNSNVVSTLISGGNLGTVVATIKDANGNTVTTSSAMVTATIIGPGGYSQIISTPAISGVASLNLGSLNLNTAGSYTVTFASPGLTAANASVTVSAGAASKLADSTLATTLTSGANLGTVSATIKDANGNTVTTSAAPVTITITGPSGYSQTVAAAASAGVAVLNLSSLNLTTAGTYIVATSSSGLTGVTATVTVAAGAAAKLVTSSVPSTLVSGGNLGSVTATIQDASSNTVTASAAPVTATITGPAGYSQTISTVAVNGVATLNLGSLNLNTAGNYTVTFASPGLTAAGASVSVSAGAASKLADSTLASTLTSGNNLGTVSATVKDANGNTVTTSVAPVTITITGPNGYSQTVTAAASAGVAVLNLSSLNLTTAGNYMVTTNSPGLTGATATVTISAGAASKLVTSSVPSTLVSGNNLGSVTATVQDTSSNTVTTSVAPVTVTITGPGGYSQTISALAVNGVATLNLGSLNLTTAGNYTLTTTSSGLLGTTSTVSVTPGTASKLATSSVGPTVVADGNLGTIVANIEDASSNTVTASSAVVTTTITGPNGYSHTVAGTAVNGVASLNLSTLNLAAAGTYTVTTTGSGLSGTTSTVTVTAGAASKLVTGAIVSTLTSGGNVGAIVATIQDANGNTVTSSTAIVTATITGPNSYSKTISGPAVNGMASLNLSSLALNIAGPYTVTMSSSGLTGSSASVMVTPAQATQLVLGTLPAGITSGQNLPAVSVTAEDNNGNVASSYTGPITAILTGPNGFSRTVTGTAVSGVVTLDLSGLTPTAAGSYTLSVTGSGTTATSTTITVAAAAQTVTLPEVPSSTFGTGAIAFPTTSSAGLPVTYVVTGPAMMNGSSLTITGAGTITVTATQAGDASHSPLVTSTTIVIAKAASSTKLSTSGGVATSGSPVILTAQVTSTVGTPSGSVTFLDGSTVLGTVPVTAAGTATLSLSTLPTGVLSLTASYGGDNNYLSSGSTSTVAQVEDFAIAPTAGTPSVAVVPGASVNFSLALTPATGGFLSSITLTATGLPPGATYSFSPATVTPGSAVTSTVLTVQTAKPINTARNLGSAAGIAFALLLLPLGLSRKARSAVKEARLLSVVGALLLLGSAVGLTGCGSSNGFFGRPAQTYTVTVTGTSGTLVHSTQVVLNVQ